MSNWIAKHGLLLYTIISWCVVLDPVVNPCPIVLYSITYGFTIHLLVLFLIFSYCITPWWSHLTRSVYYVEFWYVRLSFSYIQTDKGDGCLLFTVLWFILPLFSICVHACRVRNKQNKCLIWVSAHRFFPSVACFQTLQSSLSLWAFSSSSLCWQTPPTKKKTKKKLVSVCSICADRHTEIQSDHFSPNFGFCWITAQ